VSTSNSPIEKLRAEAARMVPHLKRASQSKANLPDLKFGIVMDDKVISIEMSLKTIRESTPEALEELLVREMQGKVPS
jgi:hypothetical protein